MGERTDGQRRSDDAARREPPAGVAAARGGDWNPLPGLRETLESIVVAFTLALLFLGF